MKWILRAVALGACLAVVVSLCGFTGFARECDDLRGRVLRLHILAHSDSAEDQALKLKVRDAVTVMAAHLFDEATTAEDAEHTAEDHLPELVETAQQCVYDEGYDYPVQAHLVTMYFPTRTYDGGTLPAGTYRAVRFTIGAGAGHNWWCVVFPPICVAAATGSRTLSDVLDKPQTDVVEHPQHYEVRLKLLEWWEQLRQAVEK